MKTFSVSRNNPYIRFFVWCWDIWLYSRESKKINFCELFWGTVFWPVGVVLFHFLPVFQIMVAVVAVYGISAGIYFFFVSIPGIPTWMFAAISTAAVVVIEAAIFGIVSLITRMFSKKKAKTSVVPVAQVKATKKAISPIRAAIAQIKARTCPVWEINGETRK